MGPARAGYGRWFEQIFGVFKCGIERFGMFALNHDQ